MNKLFLRFLSSALLMGALALCGYWLLFTQFMVYDDEGYVLWSLRSYFAEGGLYTTVYSQYGPFLYTLYHLLHAVFRLDFDNETGRLLTLVYWLGASGFSGIFVWRQTRSHLTALGATVLTFGGLLVMINEPIHPGGLLTFLAAAGAVLGAICLEQNRPRNFAALGGAIGIAMVLTKINVGAFFLIAAGSFMAVNLVSTKLARASLWLTAIGSLAVPYLLMQRLWPAPWVAIFALTFSCAALALICVMHDTRHALFGWRAWRSFLGWGLAVAGIVLGLTWGRGTDWSALWDGVVVAPLHQPVAYAHAANWPPLVPWFALAMFILALIAQTSRWSWRAHLIATLRFLAGGWFLLQTLHVIDNALGFFSFYHGLVFTWLMAMPLNGNFAATSSRARTWLAWVLIWQTLHAYPVAGSQMGWGAFLWIPLAITGCFEAVQFWVERARSGGTVLKIIAASTLAASCGMTLIGLGYPSSQRYLQSLPLDLHGARHLRLSDDITSIYHILDKNIRLHGDTLFSYPGMFSLNIWTERPTPTSANVTHWFSLLSETQQQAVINRLESDDRAVVVTQSYLVNYLVYHGFPPRGRLQHYLVQNFTPAFRIDSFELWVKKSRTIAPISTAVYNASSPGNDAALELVAEVHGEVASIEIRGLFPPHQLVAKYVPSEPTPWMIEPLRADGSPVAPSISAGFPTVISGIARITVPMSSGQKLPPRDLIALVLLDAQGTELERLRFLNPSASDDAPPAPDSSQTETAPAKMPSPQISGAADR